MGVVYRHTVEALLERVIARFNLLTSDELAKLKFERARDCDIAEFLELSELAAARLSPGATQEVALEKLGRELLQGYTLGLVGKTLLMVAKMVGPKRTLLKMPETFNAGDTVTKASAVERGPRHVQLTIQKIERQHPNNRWLYRGLLSETMVVIGVREHSVELSEAVNGVAFDIRW